MSFPALKFGLLDNRGIIAIKFALALPVVLAAFGFAVDRSRYITEQGAIQAAADAAALAAAKELSLADRKYDDLAAIAQSVAEAYSARSGATKPQTRTSVTSDPMQVEVHVMADFRSIFTGITLLELPGIRTRAIARVVGKPNICVLGLNSSELGTISLEHQARVTGQNCAVYSNSDNVHGIKAKNSATLSASVICSRGGKDGGPGNFSPSPLVDCPSFEDPLASRPEPPVGPCDAAQPALINGAVTLDPGTYCGLEIAAGGDVTLRDGIFVFKDKPLIVRNGGKLQGAAAGLYFTGANASFTFEQLSTISLTAPASGAMAGLLVFTSRTQDANLQHSILSDDARVMVGTLYIPQGELRIDATNPIADQSAYTAIVADKMRLYGGPHLVLNTNYADTDVPVPDGIMGAGQPVVLAK